MKNFTMISIKHRFHRLINKHGFAALITVLLVLSAFIFSSCSSDSIKDYSINSEQSAGSSQLGSNGSPRSSGKPGSSSNSSNSGSVEASPLPTAPTASLLNESGSTLKERIKVPKGFERVSAEAGSYAEYLRSLPLKPHGSKVKYYNGGTKPSEVYEAVLDIDIGDRDLQQCADAVMRLWAEYLYGRGLFDRIHFNFTNGFKCDYPTWMAGNRVKVEGNKAYWVKQTGYSNEYSTFRKYMDMVFAYAGTLSLSQEMMKLPLSDMAIGDVFLKGSDPGHCVLIIDMAVNKITGEKIFLIAQSYMPAQDIHILKNNANGSGNPWYPADFGEKLVTPEWTFNKDQLYRFAN